MSIIAVGSMHGSPGATTLAMGLGAAWPGQPGRSRLVVEADPDGGMLAGLVPELRADRTLADAAVSVRRGFVRDEVLACARPVWGGLPVLVAPPSAEQVGSSLTAAGERLAAGLAGLSDVDAIVDVGRLTSRSAALPFAQRAVATLLVCRPAFADIALLTTRVRELRAVGVSPWLVTVGSRPYAPEEIAETAGCALLAALPSDPASAGQLVGASGSGRRLGRSLLWRSLVELASRLHGETQPPLFDGDGGPDAATSGQADGPLSRPAPPGIAFFAPTERINPMMGSAW